MCIYCQKKDYQYICDECYNRRYFKASLDIRPNEDGTHDIWIEYKPKHFRHLGRLRRDKVFVAWRKPKHKYHIHKDTFSTFAKILLEWLSSNDIPIILIYVQPNGTERKFTIDPKEALKKALNRKLKMKKHQLKYTGLSKCVKKGNEVEVAFSKGINYTYAILK